MAIINWTDLPGSGLELTRTRDLGQFFDVSGHGSLLMGREGDIFEVWIYPFKFGWDFQFYFNSGARWTHSRFALKSCTVRPESTTCVFSSAEYEISETIFAPMRRPVICILLDVQTRTPLRMALRFSSDLKLMWPAHEIPREPVFAADEATGALVVKSGDGRHAGFIGWADGVSEDASCLVGEQFENVPVILRSLPAGRTQLALVIAGSDNGIDRARECWLDAARNPIRLLAQCAEYYRRLDTEMLSVETPDEKINEAFRWAKVGLDKCYQIAPFGEGFVAGYGLAGDGGRPGFGWFFGRDGCCTSFSACALGDFEKVRRNLDLYARWQVSDGENKGKVYHEVSAAHEWVTDPAYAYVAGDATPFYVVAMADYLRWSGDIGYVRANWRRVLDAMDWCYRVDVAGDLLIDNPPAGHEWYDYGEKNMIDLVAIWLRALESAAEMGGLLGDPNVGRWRGDALKVREILNTDFWDPSRGYLYDRKLPDGTMLGLTTANPAIPLLWNQIDPEKAHAAIDRLARPDMTIEWGVRTNSSEDEIYRPEGYHEGTVWPLTTGWAALAAFANHRSDIGMKHLMANVMLTWDFCLGFITEVLDGEVRVPGGCPHQAWSEAMIIQPIIEGLFGIRVDAVARKISFAPHLPSRWESAAIRNLRVGENRFDIEFSRSGTGPAITIVRTAGTEDFTATISPGLPLDTRVRTSPSGEEQKTPADLHVAVPVCVGSSPATVTYDLRYEV